ncbi:CKLF-like MARVEL transmembrane domain-containing protein 8 [Eupeodes corollae]|uniref:CKLF-like MARVEL transmembrane domain-containing protein 8 n=1 Tax=Eupeodes corollae TaxID=290404 RepID=UPI00249025E8|nr:CKLF-like MARVEL transmembrane domain-containing protein 8 [Eupeodes corollae]
MADPGFPGRHTTTTQVTQTSVSPQFRFDKSYIHTIPGMIKIACIVFNLLGFISIQVSAFSHHSRGSYFSSIAMTGFWFTVLMLAAYLFHVCEKFYKIPWLKIEMYFCALWTVLYLFAACFAATFASGAYKVGALFGFIAMCLYGYDAFLKYNAVRRGEIAQGVRIVEQRQQQTTVTIA